MNESDKNKRQWVSTWRQASSALRQLKKQELQAAGYYEKNRRILDEMIQYACANRKIRRTSGLVEQQRLFMKLRNRESAGQ